jgi:hypothetical protein
MVRVISPRVATMFEAYIVASHAFDAGFLTSCASWLAVVAYSKARQSVSTV